MRDITTMTKSQCLRAIENMFGFETYRGIFGPNDDIETLRRLVASQRDKYLVIAGGR